MLAFAIRESRLNKYAPDTSTKARSVSESGGGADTGLRAGEVGKYFVEIAFSIRIRRARPARPASAPKDLIGLGWRSQFFRVRLIGDPDS